MASVEVSSQTLKEHFTLGFFASGFELQSLPLLGAPIEVEELLVPSVEIGFDDFVVFTAGFLSKFSDFSEGCRSL